MTHARTCVSFQNVFGLHKCMTLQAPGRIMQGAISLLVVMASLLGAAVGQINCQNDNDCPENQYCYDTAGLCANFTNCDRYNRVEGSTRARHAKQCGKCKAGYSAEIYFNQEEAQRCVKDTLKSDTKNEITSTEQEETLAEKSLSISKWAVPLIVFTIILGFILFQKCRRAITDETTSPDKTSSKPMLDMNDNGPSAPPHPDESEQLMPYYNRNCDCVKIDMPVQPIKLKGEMTIDGDALAKTRSFQPPHWVSPNPHYSGEEFSGGDENNSLAINNDDDTTPSSWTPGYAPVAVPSRPFAAIADEQRENATNTVLDSVVCVSTADNQEHREFAPEHSSHSSNEGRSNNDRENPRRGNPISINNYTSINLNINNAAQLDTPPGRKAVGSAASSQT